MRGRVRRAGRANLDDGSQVIWSVADGRRGRRWRAVVSDAESVVEVLLLEIDLDGRLTRLELAATAGLLTLHPDPPGGLHGNVVTAAGVRHLAVPWSDDHELAIHSSPIAWAVTVHRLAATVPVGEGRAAPLVSVDRDLEVTAGRGRYLRVGDATWAIEDGDGTTTVSIDDHGLPAWPAFTRGEPAGATTAREREHEPATEWPLELGPDA